MSVDKELKKIRELKKEAREKIKFWTQFLRKLEKEERELRRKKRARK